MAFLSPKTNVKSNHTGFHDISYIWSQVLVVQIIDHAPPAHQSAANAYPRNLKKERTIDWQK